MFAKDLSQKAQGYRLPAFLAGAVVFLVMIGLSWLEGQLSLSSGSWRFLALLIGLITGLAVLLSLRFIGRNAAKRLTSSSFVAEAAAIEAKAAERTKQLSALYDVLSLSSDMISDMTVVLNQALEKVLGTVPAQAGAIHQYNEIEKTFQLVTAHSLPAELVQSWQTLSLPNHFWQRVMESQAYVLTSDPGHYLQSLSPDTPLGVGELFAVAIRKGDQLLGILSVFIGKDRPDEAAFRLLVSLADQLAVIIENAQLRKQAEQLAVVEERNRLARELHDSVTQALYSTSLFAEAARRNAHAGNVAKASEQLDDVAETSLQALKEMRLLVHRLRPSSLEQAGLIPALEQRLKAVETRAGIRQ